MRVITLLAAAASMQVATPAHAAGAGHASAAQSTTVSGSFHGTVVSPGPVQGTIIAPGQFHGTGIRCPHHHGTIVQPGPVQGTVVQGGG